MAYSSGNGRGKTHYAGYEAPNESDNNPYWSETLCGLDYPETGLTDEEDMVTCKNCLRLMKPKKKSE